MCYARDSAYDVAQGELGNVFFFFFQAEDGIRDSSVTGVQTCALPILLLRKMPRREAQLPPRPAWPVSQGQEGCRLRSAASREAEGQAHLLHPGDPVPRLLPEGVQQDWRHRRTAAAAA